MIEKRPLSRRISGSRIESQGLLLSGKSDKPAKALTEDELIHGCIREDAACQKAVYDRYASRMLGVCYRYARNSADAEDIRKTPSLRFLARSPSLNRKALFEGWIRRIVVHTAIKKYSLSATRKN